jgi:putative transposase
VASAVNSEGFREILGICEGAKEDKSGWSAFLRHLVDRGLKGVQLVISDACRGLVESVADFLPEARYQRCMVHFYRNVFSHVPSTRVREVSHMLKAIHFRAVHAAGFRCPFDTREENRLICWEPRFATAGRLVRHPANVIKL